MTTKLQSLINRITDSEAYDTEAARNEISDQIHAVMEREGVSKAELARRLGKSRAYVTKLLQGNNNFTIDSAVRVARALGYIYAPIFVPKMEWSSATAVHLYAKEKRPAGSVTLDNEGYVPVASRPLGEENAENTGVN
jgi:transcriptional regulator with XRE-family HTH domain